MKIVLAKNSGFCVGVKNAVDTARSMSGGNNYVLGEIIHNADVVSDIKKNGLKVVENLSEIPDGARVIFRSHGVPEIFYGICKEKNIEVIDCTCRFVQRTQKIVKEQFLSGKHIVIIGEKTHPEVEGLLGWCNGTATIIGS